MQFLPLLFSFFLMVSVAFSYLFQGLRQSALLNQDLAAHLSALNNLENCAQKSLFKQLSSPLKKPNGGKTETLLKKTIPPSPRSSQKAETSKKESKKTRNYRRTYACAKLNLYPLFKEGRENQKELFFLLQKLLEGLFPELFQEITAESLILELIQKAQPLILARQSLEIETLVLKNAQWQNLLYRLLQGSQNYALKNSFSLLDYVKIQKNAGRTICLKKCPPEMLTALFGKTRGEKILRLRSERKEFKLANILAIYEEQTEILPIPFKAFFCVSHSSHSSNGEIQAFDEKRRVCLKKPF
ncbi:MAG: hypothetical protein WC371_00280 [Parachlamydiales bacterium]|jgi:hypothetical protein